jgi:nitrile hydratase subunit beta
MQTTNGFATTRFPEVVLASGERPSFRVGDRVRVLARSPIGHYRVPTYVRGRTGAIQRIIEPAQLDNEREGFGLNAGSKLRYFRTAFFLLELWPNYQGPSNDTLFIEIYETWLERV